MRISAGALAYLLNEAGPGDRVFNVMLLGGPFVLLLLAIVGRTTFTVALVGFFLVSFVGYVLYKGGT